MFGAAASVHGFNRCPKALHAILTNLLLGSETAADEAAYGAPADTYGAPYEAPVESYEPAPTYEEPVADEYGSPAADPVSYEPLPSYGAPARF